MATYNPVSVRSSMSRQKVAGASRQWLIPLPQKQKFWWARSRMSFPFKNNEYRLTTASCISGEAMTAQRSEKP